jgi:PAS domain S-box-containing protein
VQQLANNIKTMSNSIQQQFSIIKQNNEKLHTTQSYIKDIINSMPSMILGVDKNGIITQWNKTAEKITGTAASEVLKQHITKILPYMENELESITKSIEHHLIKTKSRTPRLNDKQTIYEDITIYPLTTTNIAEAIIRIDDVTKAYNLEMQLNQSRKMDAIGQLAGGVAHDFNNILGGIIGAAEIIKRKNLLQEKEMTLIDIIVNAATRAAELTQKLLTFSRQGQFSPTPVDIHVVLNDTISILEHTIDKTITVSIKKKAKNSIINGDNSLLQNAMLNMGINAAHAMPNGGKIDFTTSNIILDETYCDSSSFSIIPGEYIEIEIRDTGCGISLENITKIFDPFFTTKENKQGTGLGLAAVIGMVQDHKGAIHVNSEINSGTAFHVLLPVSHNQTPPVTPQAEMTLGTGTILLVDDEEIIRITTKSMLEDFGYSVICAKNGIEAVDIYKKQHSNIDLIILDVIMPIMSGREALIQLHEIDKNCNVIMTSGFSQREELNELKKCGLKGYIRKPYSQVELNHLLIKFL